MTKYSSIIKAQRSMYSQILCYVSKRFFNILNATIEKVLQHPECNEAWKNRVAGVRAERSYRDYDAINGESTEFEWNIFPGFTTLQLCDKISDLLSSMGQTPESFTGRILFLCQCSMTFSVTDTTTKMNDKECQYCENICWEIWYWSMVIYWTRF